MRAGFTGRLPLSFTLIVLLVLGALVLGALVLGALVLGALVLGWRAVAAAAAVLPGRRGGRSA